MNGRQDLCPACGNGNHCEVARTGSSAVRCWCMEFTSPAATTPASTALATNAPQGATSAGTACFCRQCLANEKAPALARASSSISR